MQKEILTREIIKVELNRQHLYTVRGVFIANIIWLIIFALGARTFRLVYYVCISMFIFSSLLLLYTLILLFMVRKNRFQVTIDTLITCEDKESLSDLYVQKQYKLLFASCGKYAIPTGNNYKWSKLYCMTDTGVYNYSIPGDKFYLVKMSKKTIFLAYNTKLFEFKE